MTRVTIAVPTFNGARFLSETLASLRSQTLPPADLVVLDDASSDDSAAVAASMPEVRVIRSAERRGLAANWNAALALCETPYLVLAHQDDVYEPRFAETLVAALEAHPRAAAAHCKASTIDEHGRPFTHPAGLYKERFWPRDAAIVEREPAAELAILRQGNYVIAPSAILRMSIVRQLGPFDTRYAFVTDWEYWLRASLAGHTLVGVVERLVRFRRHEATATRDSERSLRRYEEELELLLSLPAPTSLRPLENNLLADFVARLAAGDRAGAAALLRFGHERIARFRYSTLMRFALHGGRAAGRLLALAQAAYLRTLAARPIRA
ncbi:MAG TPA: glycosyltransferase [Thermoanaerobaculia bacterium]|jgi:GT2 family glycosyltransferase